MFSILNTMSSELCCASMGGRLGSVVMSSVADIWYLLAWLCCCTVSEDASYGGSGL